jgi:hypothetical protein
MLRARSSVLPKAQCSPGFTFCHAFSGAARLTALPLSLLQVSARLPPPVQVLNTALSHSSRAQREAVVQQALGGGKGDIPGTTLDAVGAAAHQLIDDMEDQQVSVL